MEALEPISSSVVTAKGKGKGKGKCGPPPPKAMSAAGRAEAKEAAERKKEEEKRERAERLAKQKADAEAREALKARLPFLKAYDIYRSIPWHSAKLSVNLAGGRENSGAFDSASFQPGIKVVELVNDSAVCLRQVREIVPEFIAESVAAALKIPVARTRVVRPDEAEFHEINEMKTRTKADPGWDEMKSCRNPGSAHLQGLKSSDPGMFDIIMKDIGRTYSLAVLEFVEGVPLDCAQNVEHAVGTWLHHDAWRTMGRICVLDMLLNNMDRLPLPIFDNRDGNLGNIMVISGGANVIGIDQQVNSISDDSGREKYLERVRCLVKGTLPSSTSDTSTESPKAKEIGEAIRQVVGAKCGVTLLESAISSLLEGWRSGLMELTDCWTSGDLADALDLAHSTALTVIVESQAVWEGGADGAWSKGVINSTWSEPQLTRCIDHIRTVAGEISSCVLQTVPKQAGRMEWM